MKYGLIWLILAVLLANTLVSCSKRSAEESGIPVAGSETAGNAETEAEEEMTAAKILKTFEKVDYSGETFTSLASYDYLGVIAVQQIPGEEENGEAVNDSLIKRDQLLEDYFGVDIQYLDVLDTEMAAYAKKFILSGDDTADIVLASVGMTAVSLFNGDLLYNLNDVPYLDLSKEWWNKNTIRDFKVNGQIYMASGDITTRTVVAPFALFFNQKLLTDYGIESPYIYAENGTWTVDVLAEMIKDRASDLDSDGKYTVSDFYGLSPESMSLYAFYVSAGSQIIENGGTALTAVYNSERNIGVVQKMADMLSSQDVMNNTGSYTVYDANTAFKEDRSVFLCCALCDMTKLRDMTSDFGIVPLPKYDESQTDYYSAANICIGTAVVVPKTVSDPEKTGLLTEAVCAVSHYTSLEAEYEITLQTKQTRDAESAAMLELVVNSTTYDFGNLNMNNMTGIYSVIENALVRGTDLISGFEKQEKNFSEGLTELNQYFTDGAK